MYQDVHFDNIAERASAPEVAGLLHCFERHRAGATGASFERLTAELLPEHGDHMMVIARAGDGDYLYRTCGSSIARDVGRDLTGGRVSSMTPQVARFTRECYDRALASGEPLLTVHRSVKTARVMLWERLILPAIMMSGEAVLVVFSKPLHVSDELLTTVLESSPTGIVALRACRNGDGDIVRATVTTANRRAAHIAGDPRRALLDGEARDVLPFLADPTTWRRCLYVIELRRSDVFETCFARNGREIWLQVSLAPLRDGLVMTLNDISELMEANLALRSRAATLALEIGRERATSRALSQELGRREERELELRRLAETDPLTALLNRRSLIDKAQAAMTESASRGEETSLLIIDLDHFKQINDSHGHAAGDAVIRAFADLLLGHMRPTHLVSRLGGEEFAVVLPATGAAEARRIAERFQALLRATDLPVNEELDLQVSASIGIATHCAGESFGAFVARADKQLYRAKNEGRDCIRTAEDPISAAA